MGKVDQIFGTDEATSSGVVAGAFGAETQAVSSLVSDIARTDGMSVEASKDEARTPMSSLAAYVMARFKENEHFRMTSGVTDRLNYAMRANRCQFSAEQEAALSNIFGPDIIKRIFVPISSSKIRAARSLLIDLMNQSGEPLFRVEPSPMPIVSDEIVEKSFESVAYDIQNLFSQLQMKGANELPPEVMARLQQVIASVTNNTYDAISNKIDAEAKVRAERMQKKVHDIIVEGNGKEAFVDFIGNVCTYGTGVVIGPVLRNVAKNECVTNKRTGVAKYRRVVREVPYFESVNPHDCYPAPDAKNVGDGAFCVVVRYVGDDLYRMAENGSSSIGDGWISDIVKIIIARHPRGGVKVDVRNYDNERRYCENNGFVDSADCTFEGIRCFASVRGSELLDMGISKSRYVKGILPDRYYKTETIVIDNRVVYCRIYQDELELPISKGVFYTLPGSWWGESIADKVAMCQTSLNNCIKALLQNMAVSSSAIFWVNDVQRMANKSPNALKLKAGMTVPFLTSMAGNTGAPIGALSVPSTANELLAVWNSLQNQADIDSGIPRFAEGQSAGQSGALRTSSGLSQFTEHMMRGMKMVMTDIDNNVISSIARKTADWVLLNDDDMSLKGDVTIVPVGLIGKVMKVQRDSARLQLLQLVLNSQLLTQAIGIKGVVSMFRPSLVDTDLNPDDIVPSKDRMDALEAIEGIKQIFQATSAAQGVEDNAAQAQQGGGVPGIQTPQVEQPRGGVAERRGVA